MTRSAEDGARLGTLFGFPIYVHESTIMLAPQAMIFVLLASSGSGLLNGLAFLIIAAASVLAHELGHAFAARAQGVPVKQVVLTWYGGFAEFYMRPATRQSEILIALAGPATNLAIATIAFAICASVFGLYSLDASPTHYDPHQVLIGYPSDNFVRHSLQAISAFNLSLGAFNLLPGLPLDGGHVLRSALNLRLSRGRASWIAAWVGFFVALATIVGGWFARSPWTIVIGISLAITAWRYRRGLAYE